MNPLIPVAVITIVLIGLFGYNTLYMPKQAQIRAIRGEFAEEQTNQRTRAEIAGLLDRIAQYRSRLPEEPEPSWLVREAVAIAEQSGAQVTSITHDNPQTLGQFTRLAVNLQLNISYHQVGAFVDALERSRRFIRVDGVNIGAQDGATGLAIVRITISTLHVQLPVASAPR